MIIRLLIILACVVVFINGCNSVISQQFGTHKLRTYTMDEVASNGLGDADFVQVNGAWLSGDFVYKAAKSPSNPGVIIYPILTREQLALRDSGLQAEPALIAWTTDFPSQCVEAGNCIQRGEINLRGIVRELPKDRRAADLLKDKGYRVSETALRIEHGREPLAWYWNVLMMLGAVALAVGVEANSQRRKRLPGNG
ncbi:MAG: hypothetical protein KDC66_18250 [Phaeodactylibacter sp.]|nr:hypothetical protein [Phaeodactylibacter sp.]MCB9276978.1 hypothetical protein [Lewinellaceae bacterium]